MWKKVFMELSKVKARPTKQARKDMARNLSNDMELDDVEKKVTTERKDVPEIDIKRLVDFLHTRELSSKAVIR